jgi:hypothetical protein
VRLIEKIKGMKKMIGIILVVAAVVGLYIIYLMALYHLPYGDWAFPSLSATFPFFGGYA